MEKVVIVGAGGFGREVKMLIDQINEENPKYQIERFYDDRGSGKKINLFGASGHAKVVMDCIRCHPDFEIGYVFDDDPKIKNLLDVQLSRSQEVNKAEEHPFLVAIGNNKIRKEKVMQLATAYQFSCAVVHSSSILSSFSKIGKGSVVMPLVCVNTDAVVGEHVILNTGAVIEHDCQIGNFVHISPNASLAGGVKVGEGTHVGIGAQVIPEITIGKWATIGAGAVIIKNVPDGATVVGSPGRIVKLEKIENKE